MLEHLWCCTNE